MESLDKLDQILDATLDDLDDLPEFKPFPAGGHKVLASFSVDKINKKDVIKLDFTYVEKLELADPQDEVPKAGDTCNTLFMLDNEYGVGNFKKCAAPFREALGFGSNREIVEGVKDVECIIITTIRKDKNDPDKKYLNIKEIMVT